MPQEPDSLLQSRPSTDAGSGSSAYSAQKGELPPFSAPNRRRPAWLNIAPYFLSAVLFLSGFFALFAALPFQALWLQRRYRVFMVALVLNALWVALLGGPLSLAFFAVFAVVPGAVLGWSLAKKKSITGAMALTLLGMAAMAIGVWLGSAMFHRVSPVQEIQNQVQQLTAVLETSLTPEAQESLKGASDWSDWRQAIVHELPSAFILFGVIEIWLSSIVLIRANPAGRMSQLGLTLESIKRWRLPDFLVWPAIVCGYFVVFEQAQVTPWATNVFRVLMGLYAIQGIAILGAFFDAWRIQGVLRMGAYFLVVFLMMPVLLGIGFFDQWFDFRKNLRQST